MMDPLDTIVSFLKQTNEIETAQNLLKTFKKYAQGTEQYDQLGRLFNDIKDYPSAIECAKTTLVMSASPQQMYSSRANLAKLYNHINDPEKSLQYTEANLAINESDYEAKMEKVFSHYLKGDYEYSHQLTKELVDSPDTPNDIKQRSTFNLGSYQMDEGDFKSGIRNFIDVGHKIGIWPKQNLKNPWDGRIIENATIAIIAEGGIGDEIINVRFMRHIKNLGMKPVWVTSRDDIANLFNRNGFTTVKSADDVEGDEIFWCLSFYLPIILDLDKDDLDIGTYLTADVKYLDKWEKILPKGDKVALRWSGNPHYEQDLHRSLSLTKYMEAFGHLNKVFVSVQRDFNMEEIQNYNVFDASPYLETLDDLIACLYWCDQTITSCTSVAHVSAACGIKTIVFPPISSYYVWLGSGNDWYGDHVKVYRQKKLKDWDFIDDVQID